MSGPTEPRADLRSAASELWQIYVALVDQGFSDQQALVIVGQILASTSGGEK